MQPRPEPIRYTAGQVRALNVRSISKRFPGVKALDDVSFDVWSGEVHALVGENGAGKSTLIKLVTGAEHPDTGIIEIFGEPSPANAHQRRREGVSAIYQELMTVPMMSCAANVFLSNPPRSGLTVRRQAMRKAFLELTARLGLSIDPDARAGDLSIADRQMLEIMRSLTTRCRILIMDEPTAAIGAVERKKLYDVIGELKRSGTAIIYISHDLEEVLALSDRISVLRNGTLVRTDTRDNWTKEKMVAAMVGGKPSAQERVAKARGEPVLSVRDIAVTNRVSNISFDLHKGEILGIAGLVGSGRSEILRAIAGDDPAAAGSMIFEGRTSALPRDVRAAIASGIVYVPEDRKAHGFVPLLSGIRNVALTDMAKVSHGGVMRSDLGRSLAEAASAPLGFDPVRLDRTVRTLSGGNQQKLVIAKWLHRRPKILLLDEPTRGVDIGAKAEIYASIRKLAETGLAVILVSSELQEVVEQSDRVLVLARGRIEAELAGADAAVDRILAMIFAVENKQ